jgi:hypothetical protein
MSADDSIAVIGAKSGTKSYRELVPEAAEAAAKFTALSVNTSPAATRLNVRGGEQGATLV